MKIVVAPDSFKGSLTAHQAAERIASSFRYVFPEALVQTFPLADGGEGTIDAVFHARGGEFVQTRASAADHRLLEAKFLRLADETAILEAAQVVGLPLLEKPPLPVSQRDTSGLGQQIKAALDGGTRHFIVGIGGSSTNDGGAGMLSSLGLRLLDGKDRVISPRPEALKSLKRVDFSSLDPRLKDSTITVMCDVDNPLCGPDGATFTYGPQKGVPDEKLLELDEILRNFSQCCFEATGKDLIASPGAGAAGGLGFAFLNLGAELKPGAAFLMDLMGISQNLSEADLVITGEGRSDSQTLRGKLPYAVAMACKPYEVPVFLLSGSLEAKAQPALEEVFAGCFSIVDRPMSLEAAMANAESLLSQSAMNLARTVRAILRRRTI
jgi:glycerate kinase